LMHRGFSFCMALIVLCSTMSFTIEKHFCGDYLIDTAIFSDVKRCGSEIPSDNSEEIIKKPCCKDVVDLIEGQDELQKTAFDDLDFEEKIFLTALTYTYVLRFEALPKKCIPYKNYKPPNLVYEIHKLDQVYLI